MSANELLGTPATETLRARSDQKKLPVEVWALLILDGSEVYGRSSHDLVLAIDECGAPFLAFASREEAWDSAAYHLNTFGLECEPVRLK